MIRASNNALCSNIPNELDLENVTNNPFFACSDKLGRRMGRIIHQVLELLIQSKVALLTKADPVSFNDPYDEVYGDKVLTSKDQDKKIILRYSNGILAPYYSSGDKEVHIAISIPGCRKRTNLPIRSTWLQK
ncbi:hypothetical protein GLOIN_2v1872163 [Rhizophagus irregularis DAOM 181602=DAOM 197198]|uniref:Uncharacterized protein n=1 Tax=Rhizophagus irregularis (strain DAOM 181602 / DAOM 197198 / MUCL 43194) TaxID=747089 RepID=A0A2P4QFC1_RHIID|nr:hypothetical protein GLOIN_2v1872163 [Rhizophagus irregularis DAOM 181602=DAOM 197198]POG76316.1 hypothetical protein GLOIN_2v1872163 [Rhizophagus irregularis DAOM 181602=DAOM 197198]|eukprot:XP_025183182.1 hypothetical protein GLOIN_2v1872163 [Rhizophagus irregularis DAOM 181602=DAOM 197198]